MEQKGILGIKNRTENWKTARSFAPFFGDEGACRELAQRLLGETLGPCSPVKIELFWRGGRDYAHTKTIIGKAFADPYKRLFGGLRKQLQDFGMLEVPNDINYCADTHEGVKGLRSNVLNTEIDVVLETPRHIFIGEVKEESELGRDVKYVLVHQLIRQYVTTNILLDIIRVMGTSKPNKQIVPFMVANEGKLSGLKEHEQVEFMDHQGWLRKEDNILSWREIESLRGST